jgi:hypothetical protein
MVRALKYPVIQVSLWRNRLNCLPTELIVARYLRSVHSPPPQGNYNAANAP